MIDFDLHAVKRFVFGRCEFDPQTGRAELGYAFDDGPEMVETLQFAGAPFPDLDNLDAIGRALKLVHLVAGVSYFKAAVPRQIQTEGFDIDEPTAKFMQHVYEQGLGEFAYRNGLSLAGRIRFPYSTDPIAPRPALPLRPRALVAIGGGKDSLVTIEALRALGVEQTVCWIGSSPLIGNCAGRTGLPMLNIGRQLSPRLFDLNRAGAWNGHIPVTAVNSAIMVLAATIHGYDQVVFSNERSASYGSVIPGTGEVNHQWSKGWDFEKRFAAYVRSHVAGGLRYYSLLRPFSELAVARQFARLDRYDRYFSSCNRNFHILGERPAERWCGICPKCHFVFLALAPFMPKPRLMAIFGRNLLDDPEQAAGFDALMEYRDHKPFECVGEARESRAAMDALADSPAWREDALVRRYREEIRPQLGSDDRALAPLLVPSEDHGIPPALWERLRAHFGA